MVYLSPHSSHTTLQVEERLVSVEELLDADEVFCTGTAVVVSPVGSITYLGRKYVLSLLYLVQLSYLAVLNLCRVEYKNNGIGVVSQQVYSSLTGLQMGLTEDKMGWTMKLN
ncbi:hypothetical protein BHE74_00011842 [Ensete ventricosum]|nr:hypothetical protein BHE74_00011842 [Ensete ventricosum]